MKKLLLIATLSIMIFGCQKNKTTPAAPVTPPTTNTTTLNTQEQSLIGYWIMDSTTTYTNNIRSSVLVFTNTLTCMLDLKNSTSSTIGYYNTVDGHISCSVINQIWRAPNIGFIEIGGSVYHITSLTTSNFNMIVGGGGGTELKYYLHK